jgi:hypothetical protein
MKNTLNKYAGQLKQLMKDLSTRVLSSSMYINASAERLPSVLSYAVKWIMYLIDDFAWFLRDFPRTKAFKLTGKDWSIVFVGGNERYPEIKNLIFQDQEIQIELMSKVPIWRISRNTSSWLESGVNLVVCELSRLCPWRPTARYSFIGPETVIQMLDLPDSLDDLLVGRRIEGNRRWIRKAERQGLSYRFTKSLIDLEFFHNEMYLPFIEGRHAELARLSSFENHKHWIKQGGLVLVYQNDRPIGGSLLSQSGKVCHLIEYGIMHCDLDLIKRGAISSVIWCSLLWAKEQGATQFDLGGSNPWCTNGTFRYKARWGARVMRHFLNSRPNWVFLSNQLPRLLCERINQIGMITEIDRKHFCLYIPTADEEFTNDQIQKALKSGLEGVAVVIPGSVQLKFAYSA